jgi:hypothetical protein
MIGLGTIEYYVAIDHSRDVIEYSVKSKVWNKGMFGDPHWFVNHVAGPFRTYEQAKEIYERLK